MSSAVIKSTEGKELKCDLPAKWGDVAKRLFGSDFKRMLALKSESRLIDFHMDVAEGSHTVKPVFPEDPDGLYIMRHSLAHVLAQAVLRLYPGTKITIGPPIDHGCYYDFLFEKPISVDDLPKIEKEMRKIVAQGQTFRCDTLSCADAKKFWKERSQPFKVELIEDLEKDHNATTVTNYANLGPKGEETFIDLCRGGHVENLRDIPVDSFKILTTAGAYWRGDEKREMLTRIYVAAFANKQDLDAYIHMLEEAKRRDHRRLGVDLELFSVSELVGPGLILWHPKGALVRKLIEDYWYKRHFEGGYQIAYTPHIASEDIYKVSGHLENYSDLMYSPMDIEGKNFRVKPMNCPGHIQIFKSTVRSYRELPYRIAEMGTVYRFEKSGVLHGLLRVRGFTQDDAHIFVAPEMVEAEITNVFNFVISMLKHFGFNEYKIYLATRPEKAIGSVADWDMAIAALRRTLDASGYPYEVDEGGGAFYGPKIDLKIKDCLGRDWQCSTIQFDFNLPERFDVRFVDKDNQHKRVYMVHRALLGSLERFFGVLIEHYAGEFPLWLAPVQLAVIPVSEQFSVDAIVKKLVENGIRVEVYSGSDTISKRIRTATVKKIPLMLIYGEKEKESGNLAVRKRDGTNIQMTIEQLISEVLASK